MRWIGVLLLPLSGLACLGGPTELERDAGRAREALAELERAALTPLPEAPEALKPPRDLPGDGAPRILAALEEYRRGRRPADPARDITRLELEPSRETTPFALFADAEPARLLLEGARRESCRLTGDALPLSPRLADTETVSTEACLKWTWALVERARALEEAGDAGGAERVLLGALSLGMHLEADAAVLNVVTGRAVQEEAVFYLARHFRRTRQFEKAAAARAYAEELARFGRYWDLAGPLAVLCLDARQAPEAALRAVKYRRLPLACEVAASVAFSYFRNGAERKQGPAPARFEALEILRRAFPDPVLQAVAGHAETMLAWRPERIGAFVRECMPGAKVYE
jgi:hypothetical protein